ncbi:MAG: response regulator transcription factor [Rhodobacteraceae bacterium]|nr:response regulator transcription factor [Paracoccaceae bacterium]
MGQNTAVIADDHPMIRQGLAQMLHTAAGTVAAEAGDGLEAIAMVRRHKPNLLLLDIAMPYARGIEVFGEVRRWSPDTRVIVFSGMTSAGLIGELAQAGADGIFLKREDLTALVTSIPAIMEGRHTFGPGVKDLIENSGKTDLTARERQVLGLVAQGLSNREIGDRLAISAKTVDNHRSKLMRKINVHSVAELMSYAMREGLLDTVWEA